MSLTSDEIESIRCIRIHKILGIRDDGRRVSLCCPVHNERTPSFAVYPDNHYYCFGCGVHGLGAIDFVMALGYTFVQALEELEKYL